MTTLVMHMCVYESYYCYHIIQNYHFIHVHNSHWSLKIFVIACNQVMNGILVISEELNDLMWTALGAHPLDYLQQRYGQ